MIIEQNTRVIPVDIDDTLVMHDYVAYPNNEWLEIKCPFLNDVVTVAVNENMVRCVREEHAKGSLLFCWSSQDARWVDAVLTALDIKHCFKYGFAKPTAYFDDSEAHNWMGRRLWLDPKKAYKLVAPRVNND